MKKTLVIILSLNCLSLLGQRGIILNSPEALQSYTLFDNDEGAYLIDNCGKIINYWSNVTRVDNHPKLLPNGNLLFIKNEDIIEMDWDGNILKKISENDRDLFLEYEVIKLANGNYLCAARHEEPTSFFEDNGYNLENRFVDPEWDDTIVEVDGETGEIVWEWRISDHIIQQRDQTLANYGILSENPGLLSLDAISTFDWERRESFMINGIDYNPELDQIAISVRKISEVVIIDHSTTTEEAKTNQGGNSGRGGDILYRWGNPQNYNEGTVNDRKLFYQHNPNWIKYGEHKNKLIIYNNGLDRTGVNFGDQYSSTEIVAPDINADGSYNKTGGSAFMPMNADVTYSGDELDFYSGYTSAAQILPNGNVNITVGGSGELIELTPKGEVAWRYDIPDSRFNFFRSEKYPLDYPGFEGKDLTPGEDLQFNSYDCDYHLSATQSVITDTPITITQDEYRIEMNSQVGNFTYEFYNLAGQKVLSENRNNNHHVINTTDLHSGLYILNTINKKSITTQSIFIK